MLLQLAVIQDVVVTCMCSSLQVDEATLPWTLSSVYWFGVVYSCVLRLSSY
jgi:hypothetical protein